MNTDSSCQPSKRYIRNKIMYFMDKLSWVINLLTNLLEFVTNHWMTKKLPNLQKFNL